MISFSPLQPLLEDTEESEKEWIHSLKNEPLNSLHWESCSCFQHNLWSLGSLLVRPPKGREKYQYFFKRQKIPYLKKTPQLSEWERHQGFDVLLLQLLQFPCLRQGDTASPGSLSFWSSHFHSSGIADSPRSSRKTSPDFGWMLDGKGQAAEQRSCGWFWARQRSLHKDSVSLEFVTEKQKLLRSPAGHLGRVHINAVHTPHPSPVRIQGGISSQ